VVPVGVAVQGRDDVVGVVKGCLTGRNLTFVLRPPSGPAEGVPPGHNLWQAAHTFDPNGQAGCIALAAGDLVKCAQGISNSAHPMLLT